MIDVQNQAGLNDMDIDKVGICDVNYPIEVLDKKREKQGTTARSESRTRRAGGLRKPPRGGHVITNDPRIFF